MPDDTDGGVMERVAAAAPIGCGDRRLLEALDELGGTTARDVARAVGWGSNLRSGSQLTRRDLDGLCSRGLAKRMDDQAPTCCLRTPAGTEALGRAG